MMQRHRLETSKGFIMEQHHRFVFLLTIGIFAVLEGTTSSAGSTTQLGEQHKDDVTILFRALKHVYEPNEPIDLVMAIVNHRPEAVYVYGKDLQNIDAFPRVFGSNGTKVPFDRPPDELSVPPDHYMKIEGKRVLVAPMLRIEPIGAVLSVIPDALKLYRGHMSEGKYFLKISDVPIVHEVDNIIEIPEVNHWFDQ